MENEDASHEYAPLFDVYHHLLTVSRIFDCFNQRFLRAERRTKMSLYSPNIFLNNQFFVK